MVIHELTPAQCREVLAHTNLARLACARADQPYIVPLFYTFDASEAAMYSFSTVGQKIDWMRSNPKVCLEVDEIVNQFNWKTVVVYGRFQEIGQGPQDELLRRRVHELLEQRPAWWLPGAGKLTTGEEHHEPVLFRINIDHLSGRNSARPIGA
jgi:nitroimidazol reductase NimA-like FMN-containing flavoprotein (pyridoxamine 5'-phosphate oxidase superfamily)